jgi:hypothetical protein
MQKMTEQLKITITPDGIKVDASGFTGGKCIVEMDALEKYLQSVGIQIVTKDQKRKLEQMYSTAPGQTVQR